ncbi:hypothetical protein JW933_01585 [candidate division FCPU426 bacterium]|nr:hypothetical protein [candidate division FCPU426 bacterium]
MNNNSLQGKPGSFACREGKKRLYLVWWVAGVLLQVLASLPFVFKKIHWRALLLTSLVFLGIMYLSETLALYWGWWVWNEDLLWGPKVGLVPLEEFLLYFLVVPSLVCIQCVVQGIGEGKSQKT